MKNKYISPIVEIYDYTTDVMCSSFGGRDNIFSMPFDWADISTGS